MSGRITHRFFYRTSLNNAEFVRYAYDADGLRIGKSVNGANTTYLVDKNRQYAQVLEETTSSGALMAEYIHGDDLISQTRNGQKSWYHYDGQMSTRQLSDASATVTDVYAYDAFGVLKKSEGTTENSYLYTGEQFDATLGLYYFRARYYNHANGRFVTTDPLWGSPQDPASLHQYLYANANPVSYSDPSGLFSLIETDNVLVISSIIGAMVGAIHGHALTGTWEGAFSGAIFGAITAPAVVMMTIHGGLALGAAKLLSLSTAQWIMLISAEVTSYGMGKAISVITSENASPREKSVAICDLVMGAAGLFSLGYTAYLSVHPRVLPSQPFAVDPPPNSRAVIGKLKDLENIGENEYTLLDRLPNQGNQKANWKQNSSVLRQEMQQGLPIRDASVDPTTGELIDYPGSFLNAERYLLKDKGWTYNPMTRLWSPPK